MYMREFNEIFNKVNVLKRVSYEPNTYIKRNTFGIHFIAFNIIKISRVEKIVYIIRINEY